MSEGPKQITAAARERPAQVDGGEAAWRWLGPALVRARHG